MLHAARCTVCGACRVACCMLSATGWCPLARTAPSAGARLSIRCCYHAGTKCCARHVRRSVRRGPSALPHGLTSQSRFASVRQSAPCAADCPPGGAPGCCRAAVMCYARRLTHSARTLSHPTVYVWDSALQALKSKRMLHVTFAGLPGLGSQVHRVSRPDRADSSARAAAAAVHHERSGGRDQRNSNGNRSAPSGERMTSADVAGASAVPVQMWQGRRDHAPEVNGFVVTAASAGDCRGQTVSHAVMRRLSLDPNEASVLARSVSRPRLRDSGDGHVRADFHCDL